MKLLALLVVLAVGCSAPMTPQERALVADQTYAAEMLACVHRSPTLAESSACRAEVRKAWHVDGGAR